MVIANYKHLQVRQQSCQPSYITMSNILKDLTKFAEQQAEHRCIDKQIFVWAVICFCDFLRKYHYTLVYTPKKKKNER